MVDPEVIYQTNKTTLFYQKDDKFKIPKAIFYGRVYCNDMSYGKNRKTEVL